MNVFSITRVVVFMAGWSTLAAVAPATNVCVAVPGTVTPQAPYTNWANAATNIQTAVNAINTNNGNIVYVSNGVYYLTSQVVITKAIVLQSWNNGAVDREGTILNGNYPDTTNRCLLVSNIAAVVSGLTITNACAGNANGGGIYLYYGLVTNCVVSGCSSWRTASANYDGGGGVLIEYQGTLADCIIRGNVASNHGGGVVIGYLTHGTGYVVNCQIIGNSALKAGAADGGGVYGYVPQYGEIRGGLIQSNRAAHDGGGYYAYGYPFVTNCTIIDNTASGNDGGGAVVNSASLKNSSVLRNRSGWYGGGVQLLGSLLGCVVASNFAGGSAGGVYLQTGGTIGNCTINANTANDAGGGGVYIQCSDASVLYNNLIANNVVTNAALSDGGGIFIYNTGYPQVQNCTIVSNRARRYGGGVMMWDSGGGAMTNCIIYYNVNDALNSYKNVYTVGGTVGYSCTTPAPGGPGNIAYEPLFMDTNAANYRLTRASRCVNSGTNMSWMTTGTDLDGRARIRPYGGTVDMGAYEYFPAGAIFSAR